MFDEDEELAEDEEEILVYVEFDGSVAGNTFSNEKLHLDMIGLDKENPLMRVNGKFYEGTWQDAVGTYMFFEKDNNPHVDDPVFDVKPNLKYIAKTRQVLKMNRIFVDPKTEILGDSTDAGAVPNMETIRKAGIPPRYQDAALKSWETMRNSRMDALNRYLEKQRIREEKRANGIEPDSESDYDNPFAMYKPDGSEKVLSTPEDVVNGAENDRDLVENDEADENSKDEEGMDLDPQKLKIVDPGPSTSKNSQPWSSPSAPEEHDTSSDSDEPYIPTTTTKKRSTIVVAKKGKALKKMTKKKPNPKTKLRESKQREGSNWDEMNVIDEAEAAELLSKDLEALLDIDRDGEDSTSAANDSMEISESAAENASETTESPETLAAKRKQQKREEKMRLVSEKLKKAAEESKLKSQLCSEGGV